MNSRNDIVRKPMQDSGLINGPMYELSAEQHLIFEYQAIAREVAHVPIGVNISPDNTLCYLPDL